MNPTQHLECDPDCIHWENGTCVKEAPIARLREADAVYCDPDDPIMTGLEYGRLYDALAQLERDTGIVLASSPIQRTSGEVRRT